MPLKPMTEINRSNRVIILCLSVLVILSCTLVGAPQVQQPDPSIVETEIALRVIATNLAEKDLTRQVMQTQLAQPIPPALQPTLQPIQPSPAPATTNAASLADLVLAIDTSVGTFYCYQPPYELTITVRVSDINRGMAVYYHIEDKNTGVESDMQVIDLHRQSGNTRSATIIGGFSEEMNLQFPPLMGESYFLYQIISDDGEYRTPVYSDITFFPCAQ